MKKTLKEFLEKKCWYRSSDEFYFAKDLTLEQFLKTCQRGDWILWLFAKMNPECLRELTLAKGHCANTVRKLMKDQRSTKAVDIAIAFGEGKATIEELDDAASDAWAASAASALGAATYAADSAAAAADSTSLALAAASSSAYAWAVSGGMVCAALWTAAHEQNQEQTADICRKYLPLEIWNQNLI